MVTQASTQDNTRTAKVRNTKLTDTKGLFQEKGRMFGYIGAERRHIISTPYPRNQAVIGEVQEGARKLIDSLYGEGITVREMDISLGMATEGSCYSITDFNGSDPDSHDHTVRAVREFVLGLNGKRINVPSLSLGYQSPNSEQIQVLR